MTTNIWGERLAGAAFILVALYMGYKATRFPAGGDLFPLFVSASMAAIAAVMIARTFLIPRSYGQGLRPEITLASLKPVAMTVLLVLYVLAIFRVGYYVTTFLILVALPFALGLRRPLLILGAALGATAFIYALFEVGLNARMPSGMLF